jgi:hypothetical protein
MVDSAIGDAGVTTARAWLHIHAKDDMIPLGIGKRA